MEFYYNSTIYGSAFKIRQKEKVQNPDGYWTFSGPSDWIRRIQAPCISIDG